MSSHLVDTDPQRAEGRPLLTAAQRAATTDGHDRHLDLHVAVVAAARHPLTEPFAGGLESLTWSLVHGLRARGIEVTLFAGPGTDRSLDAHIIDVAPLRLSAAARADVSMPPEDVLREHHAYLQVMLSLARRADVDVVHNNSLHYLPLVMADAVAAPLLTTLHTPPTPWLEPAVGLLDCGRGTFAAVSAHTAAQWSHVTEATVVPNGVDTGRWIAGPGGEDLVWSGRMVPEKAPHSAVLVARAAGRRIRLAGPIGDSAYFAERLRPLLSREVEYVGHLDATSLRRLVGASAATLVTPVWDEPYGLVAAESMACGTPVVGFRRGGLPEFVRGAGGLLVDPGDVPAAAAAIAEVEAFDRAACRAHAVAHCSVDTMVERYLRIYEDLARTEVAA